MKRLPRALTPIVAVASLGAASALAEQDYAPSDSLFMRVHANVSATDNLEIITEIDHSRLAAVVGEDMPPSRVLIFSSPEIDAALMAVDPRLAVDLPMRVLAYEVAPGGESKLLFNDVDYLEHRYGIDIPQTIAEGYQATIEVALAGIPPESVAVMAPDGLEGDGLVTLESPHDFPETLRRLREAISAQDDTVWFGEIDFDERARAVGFAIEPAQMLLFGGPGAGGKAMSDAPSLGLDAFCQKVLVLQDTEGGVKVIMNDLLALAERHDVSKSIALRFINRRIQKTFTDALKR